MKQGLEWNSVIKLGPQASAILTNEHSTAYIIGQDTFISFLDNINKT